MNSDQQPTSFGLFLQTARIEKKMSIEDLAAETRIRDEVLRQLEAEAHENLPDEVFVKGFIRSYALAVGADEAEALQRYYANREMQDVNQERQTVRSTPPKRFWLAFMASVGAVLLLAGLTLYLYARLTAPSAPPEEQAKPAKAAPQATPEETAGHLPETVPTPTETAVGPQTTQPAASADIKPYRLEIKAIEETWMKIIIDDQAAQELTLAAGETQRFSADSLFNILIGNAGGIELMFNDAPVEVSGKSGQVVNLQLP